MDDSSKSNSSKAYTVIFSAYLAPGVSYAIFTSNRRLKHFWRRRTGITSHRIKMRLSGTLEDLEKWLWFVAKMDLYGLVEIVNQSEAYANRGESKESRVYLEIHLNIEE